MKSPLIASLALFCALSSGLFAQSTTISRLPVASQPSTAAANPYPSTSNGFTYAIGDSFTFGAFTGDLTLTNLRLWVTDASAPSKVYTLMLGWDDATVPGLVWTSNDTATLPFPTTKVGNFTQLDFALNLDINASHTIYFGLLSRDPELLAPTATLLTSSRAFGGDGNFIVLGAPVTDTSYYTAAGSYSAGDVAFEATFTGGNSGSPVNTPVPEPSTYGLIGAGALALLGFARRRRQVRA